MRLYSHVVGDRKKLDDCVVIWNATDTTNIFSTNTLSLMNFLGLQEALRDKLNTKADLVEYPIDKKRLFYKDFKINKEILIYG